MGHRPKDATELVFRLMMKDILRREAEAELYGEGTPDWVVSAFHYLLGPGKRNTPQYTKEEMRQQGMSPQEAARILRSQKNGWAADVYWLRCQGLTLSEAAAELEITEEEANKALRRAIHLYNRNLIHIT